MTQQDQAHVLPPFAAPASQQDASEGETLDQKAENALLWCYRRLKNSYGRLPFVEDAVAGLRERTAAAGAARQGGNTSNEVGAKMPCGAVVSNVYEAYEAGKSAAHLTRQSQAAQPSEELLGAIARGWCAPENAGKEMDSDLAFAIGREVAAHLAGQSQATKVQAVPEGWRERLQQELAAQQEHYGEVAAAASVDSRIFAGERDCTEGVIKGVEYCIAALEELEQCAAQEVTQQVSVNKPISHSAMCERVKFSEHYSNKNHSAQFKCPVCGATRRQNLNFLGRNVLICDGAKITVEKKS